MSATDESLTPDYSASEAFLQKWCKGGPWVLVALPQEPPKKGSKSFCATFGQPTLAELRDWLEEQGTKHKRNIYWTVNPCMRSMTKKPERVDIAALAWIHVDIDPRAREDHAAERARILGKLRNLPEGIPPPSCIIDSGGGYQAFWRLREPHLPERTLEGAIDAAGWNKQIELRLEGDNCHNIDRLMRLPGTVNWLNAKKRAKGRLPALARLVEFNDSQHDLASFEKAPAESAPASSSGAKVPKFDANSVAHFASVDDIPELRGDDDAQCRVVLAMGLDPDNPGKFGNSRSEWLFFVCCEMVRAGCSDEAIYAAITSPDFGISASVLDKGSSTERYALRQIERARDEAAEFQKDKDGKLYANLHNARLAVSKLGVTLEFDEFAERALISGLPDFGPQLDDAAVTRLWLAVEERFNLRFTSDRFVKIISDAARRNRRHPVREFLDGLTWDKTPRLDGWLSKYLGVKETAFTRAIGTLVLIAAVRRIREPGCKFDEMLVLEGPQGSFKSTALKVLAVLEDWFSDDLPLNAKSQQFIEQTVGKWIVEAGELKGMRKGDLETLKSCLSRQRDRARMSYGRLPLERARQFVIIGTTNSRDYLKDGTGNRRFWPALVGEIKLTDLRRDREQLWAEAAAREKAGESIRLDPSLYDAATLEQEARRVEHPWVQVLGDMLNGVEGKLRAADAWAIVGVPEGQRTQEQNSQLGEAMRALGWEHKQRRFGADPEWAYVKGDATAQLTVLEGVIGDWNKVVRVKRKGTPDDPRAEATFK